MSSSAPLADQAPLAHRLLEPPVPVDRGEVVLMLNGGMMTYPSWAPITDALLTQGYAVLGCDFRGQLLSPPSDQQPAPTRIEDHVPSVVHLLDHIDLPRVHVLGTSYGGMVSMPLVAQNPERIRSLTLVTTVQRTPPGMAEDSQRMQGLVRQVLGGGSTQPFHDALLHDFYSPEYRREHAETIANRARQVAALPHPWFEGLLAILGSLLEFDLSVFLSKVQCPTRVVHASEDRIMPLDIVHEMVDALHRPGRPCELSIHPSSGHALVIEDPHWLAEDYLGFLGSLTSGG